MTISTIGSSIAARPGACVSGTPNDRIAAWDPERSKSLEMPETTNTAARIRRAASNSASMRSNPCTTKCETPSVGRTDGNTTAGSESSVAVVYHRAGTHSERRTAIRTHRRANTTEREALGLEGAGDESMRVGRYYNARVGRMPRIDGRPWEAVFWKDRLVIETRDRKATDSRDHGADRVVETRG